MPSYYWCSAILCINKLNWLDYFVYIFNRVLNATLCSCMHTQLCVRCECLGDAHNLYAITLVCTLCTHAHIVRNATVGKSGMFRIIELSQLTYNLKGKINVVFSNLQYAVEHLFELGCVQVKYLLWCVIWIFWWNSEKFHPAGRWNSMWFPGKSIADWIPLSLNIASNHRKHGIHGCAVFVWCKLSNAYNSHWYCAGNGICACARVPCQT